MWWGPAFAHAVRYSHGSVLGPRASEMPPVPVFMGATLASISAAPPHRILAWCVLLVVVSVLPCSPSAASPHPSNNQEL